MIAFLESIANLNSILLFVVGIYLSALLTWGIARRRLPGALRVAIIGFPRSGKTTLITSIFEHVFRDPHSGFKVSPRGDETIKRLNENLSRLETGRELKPTTDQDVFAYRAHVSLRTASPLMTLLFRQRSYKLEIGDFPGEDSQAFTEEFDDWLHETPYFKWAIDADAFLFVVDLSVAYPEIARDREYIARTKKAFRAAWQRLEEHHADGQRSLTSAPVVLVFNKLDAYPPLSTISDRTPHPPASPPSGIDDAEKEILGDYDDLIQFFRKENRRFRSVFTSSFLRDPEREGRYGISRVIKSILPY